MAGDPWEPEGPWTYAPAYRGKAPSGMSPQAISQLPARPPGVSEAAGSGAWLLETAFSEYKAQPVPPSESVKWCCCQGSSSDFSPTGGFYSSKERFSAAAYKRDLILTAAVGCSVLNTKDRLSLLRYLFTEDN